MSSYPSAGPAVFSLRRLSLALERDELSEKKSAIISVGGRLDLSSGTPSIKSAGYEMRLPANSIPANFSNHDLVAIQFAVKALETENAGRFSVTETLQTRQLVPSRGTKIQMYSSKTVEAWSKFLSATRGFLGSQGLMEVTTPTLVTNPGMEPELEPFATEWRVGQKSLPVYLLTSPELHMKQLLARGFTDIFEIRSVFRNEEWTDLHEPEFTMLEWYRAFADLDSIADDLVGLAQILISKFSSQKIPAFQPRVCTVRELFAEATKFNLTPHSTREDLQGLALKLELEPDSKWDWNDIFHFIWVAKVEPTLPDGPLLVRDYPPSQAALAKLTPDGWADRLELYWSRIEIANAFHELNDPVEQRSRFIRDQEARVRYGRTPLEIDENFMNALDWGLPPSGGIALGLDRLFMVINGHKTIQETRAFPMRHQFKNTEKS